MEKNYSATIPAPKMGKRIHFRLFSHTHEDSKVDNTNGSAYIFTFPFDIHMSELVNEHRFAVFENTQVTIYPPFRSDDLTGLEVEQIHPGRIPFRKGTNPPDSDRKFQDRLTLNHTWEEEVLIADSMRLDITPQRDAAFASKVINKLVTLIRWWTQQWWITLDRRYIKDILHNAFEINEKGERISSIYSYGSIYGRLGVERILNQGIFGQVCDALSADMSSPLYVETLFDSIYFQSIGDLRRSIIEASITCESVRDHLLSNLLEKKRISNSVYRKMTKDTDILKHFDTGFKELMGQSFKSIRPEEFDKIKKLSIARNHVAHGKKPIKLIDDKIAEFTIDDQFMCILGVFSLVEWAEKKLKE